MLWSLCTLTALAAPHWSEAPPLSAPPETIRAAAAAEVASLEREADEPAADVHILLDETVAEVADDGSWRYVRRTVFEPLNADAATAWGTWYVPWDTWRESRPRLEARVMQADGDVYTLDASLVAEAAAGDDPLLLTDSKKLQAPLPQIEAGAIVEQVMTIDRVEPMLPGQFFLTAFLERNEPIERAVVHVEAPRAMKLHTATEAIDQEIDRKKKGDRQILEVVLKDARPVPVRPASAPKDTPRYRAVYISSASDWASVARAYEALVAPQLQPTGLEKLGAPLAGLSRDQAIAGALDAVLSRVRYTGVLFGQTRIVPNTPAQILERGFGDCKDQSTLLVSLLRSIGIPANLALLHASSPQNVPADVPTVSNFDHAIVYVPGPDPRWIDPTQPYESSVFPPSDLQGRAALIISPETTGLAVIPRTPASASAWTETLTFTLPYRGRGSAVEDVEATGLVAAANRSLYRMMGDDEQGSLVQRAENVLDTKVVRAANVTPSAALQTRWRSHIEAEDLGSAVSTLTGAVVRPWRFHGDVYLPVSTLGPVPSDKDEKFPLEFTPYTYEIALKVHHPLELEPQLLAEQNTQTAGDVRITREVTREPGLLTIHVTLDAGAGRLSAEDGEKLAEIIKKFEPWPADGIIFINTAWSKMAAGEGAEAFSLLRASAAAHPDDPARRADLARAAMSVGLMEAAWRELEPVRSVDSAEVRFVEAALLARDPYGRLMRGKFDREGAIRAARKALALDPEHDEARDLLISLLEVNADGVRLVPGSDPCGAAEALAHYVVDRGDNNRGEEFIEVSLRCDDREALEAWMDTVSGTPITAARITLEALDRGAAATIRGLTDRGELRKEWAAVGQAMFMLVDLGRYDLALGLAEAGGPSLSRDEQQKLVSAREYLEGLAKADARKADPNDPEGVIIAAFRASGSGQSAALEPFIASGYGSASDRAELLRFFTLRGEEHDPRTLANTLIGLSTFTSEGDARTGYRVTWKMVSGDTQERSQIFLIPGKGRLSVLTESQHMGPVGAYAAGLARKGDTAAAMTWMGWAAQDWPQTSSRAPLERSPWLHLLRLADPAVPASIEAAAMALSVERGPSAAGVQRLEALRAALTDAERQVQLDRAMLSALISLDQPAAALPVVDRLLAAFPAEPSLVLTRLGTLAYLDPDAAERELKTLDPLRTDPNRMAGVAAAVAIQRGRYGEAVELMSISGERGQLSAQNNALWFGLFMDPRPTDLLERARRFGKDMSEPDPSRANTIAAVQAASGDLINAAAAVQSAVDLGWVSESDLSYWWLVVGLIAESAGERDAAIQAYKAAPRHGVPSQDLGLRRLTALGVK